MQNVVAVAVVVVHAAAASNAAAALGWKKTFQSGCHYVYGDYVPLYRS